jgi:hypothetical protein
MFGGVQLCAMNPCIYAVKLQSIDLTSDIWLF